MPPSGRCAARLHAACRRAPVPLGRHAQHLPQARRPVGLATRRRASRLTLLLQSGGAVSASGSWRVAVVLTASLLAAERRHLAPAALPYAGAAALRAQPPRARSRVHAACAPWCVALERLCRSRLTRFLSPACVSRELNAVVCVGGCWGEQRGGRTEARYAAARL